MQKLCKIVAVNAVQCLVKFISWPKPRLCGCQKLKLLYHSSCNVGAMHLTICRRVDLVSLNLTTSWWKWCHDGHQRSFFFPPRFRLHDELFKLEELYEIPYRTSQLCRHFFQRITHVFRLTRSIGRPLSFQVGSDADVGKFILAPQQEDSAINSI